MQITLFIKDVSHNPKKKKDINNRQHLDDLLKEIEINNDKV